VPLFLCVSDINKHVEPILKQYRDQMEAQGIEPRSRESQRWFEEKIKEMTSPINRQELQRELMNMNPIRAPHVGRMYTFFYNPKTAIKLPYYDRFPLIFMMKFDNKNFQGINLHYLPIELRQQLFYRLLDRANKGTYDKQTFLRIDYQYLSDFRRFRAFRPCFKQYSIDRVRGRIVNIPSSEWETAMYLPTALWRKKPEDIVHIESLRTARKY